MVGLKKLLVGLVVIAFTLQSCSTCHSRRRAQNRKWYVEVGAKKCLNKKIKSNRTQLTLNY
jgi:cytochrome c peroxidase